MRFWHAKHRAYAFWAWCWCTISFSTAFQIFRLLNLPHLQCDLNNIADVLCNDPCGCEGYILKCDNRNLTDLMVPSNGTRRNLRALILSQNTLNLTSISFRGLVWAGRLNISSNQLVSLPMGIFRDMVNLYDLDLSNNTLSSVPHDIFEGLRSLRRLDLSSNILLSLRRQMLSGLYNIRHLILTDNRLNDVPKDTFTSVATLEELNSDAFKLCCIASFVERCTPKPDEFSSCEDLMDNYALQISIWVLGFCAFTGNLFVIVWRIRTDRKNLRVGARYKLNISLSVCNL